VRLGNARIGSPGAPVAVIGAGIGGLTLAAALARYGIPCRLFERTRQLAEVGAGTELSPNAVRQLRRLGLGPALRERAVAVQAIEIRSRSGQLIARKALGADCERAYGAPYLTVHRAHLHAALLSLTDPDRLQLGRRLASVRESEDGALLAFEDGAVLRAGVAVGADGVHSAVRTACHGDAPVPSGLVMYRGVLPVAELPAAAGNPLIRVWLGPGGHFACYPVAAGGQLNFAATVALPDRSIEEPGELAQVFAGWHGLAGAIAAAAGQVRQFPLYDRDPLENWSSHHVTLLGDAAHAMLPFLAQGTSQAIEDAVELASCLADIPVSGAGIAADPGTGLSRYAARRVRQTSAMQRLARQAAATLRIPDSPAQRRWYVLLTGCEEPSGLEPPFAGEDAGLRAGEHARPAGGMTRELTTANLSSPAGIGTGGAAARKSGTWR
jgi:salicylate hydroxylase